MSDDTGHPELPSARDNLRVLARRLARPLALEPDSIDAFSAGKITGLDGPFAALRAIAQHARHSQARSIDAVLTATELRIAMDLEQPGQPGPLPPRLGRAGVHVTNAFGVPLVVEISEFVSIPGPDPDGAANPALGALARAYLARLRAMEVESMVDTWIEGVHQLRVGVRRLRCILRVLQSAGDDVVLDSVVITVRALGRLAGDVRDCDVAVELIRSLDVPDEARATALDHIAEKRRKAVSRLRRALVTARYESQIARADRAFQVLASTTDKRLTGAVASDHLDRELERLTRRLRGDLSHASDYHEVRRQVRRVRDVAEVFASTLRKRQRAWRKRLQPVQTLLGQFNDLEVVISTLGVSPGANPAVVRELNQARIETLARTAAPLAVLVATLAQTDDR